MSLVFSLLFPSKLVNNAAIDTIYTVPSLPTPNTLRNGQVRFTNVTASAATIKLWMVPFGGTASNSNLAVPTISIAANSYLDVNLPVIDAGGMIQAQAGAASAISVFHLDGLLQT